MTPAPSAPGVYADLDALVRLRARSRGFSLLPRQSVHSLLSGRHASRLRGRGLDFQELRGYLPGDDIRTMDWRVTARTGRPHVRVYSEERDRPLVLVVDQRRSMFFGSRRAMKSVVAAETAALAAWRVLAAGDRVGALVFDDDDVVEIVPRRSEAQVLSILDAVVRKNRALRAGGAANAAMLNQVLERATRLAPHDALVCVVTDATGADAESVRHVTTLGAHNDVMLALIYDPLEAALPDAGRLVMAEGELELEVDTSGRSLRDGWAREWNGRLARVQELSRTRQIPVLPLSTADDVAAQLRSLIGRRLARPQG